MAGQQQQNQPDNSMGFLWVIIALFAAVLLIWYLFHAQIVSFIFQIKILELSVISKFSNSANALLATLQVIDPGSVTFGQMEAVSTAVGKYLRIPFALILIVFAYFMYNSSIKTQFRRVHSMKTLFSQERRNWPQITPVDKLDLLHQDIDKGEWAMAMSPVQFAKKHKLLIVEKEEVDEKMLSKEAGYKVKLDIHKANKVFVRQLGRAWTGERGLRPHVHALFAIFAAKANSEGGVATDMLRKIGASAETGRVDFSGCKELFKKHYKSKLVQKAMSRHAYENTVMASMLELARTDGVLASAEFLWLKPVDRTLWYVLNTVGRQTAPPEIGGPFAHWIAEKELGSPLIMPMIEQASTALEFAVQEIVHHPDEEE